MLITIGIFVVAGIIYFLLAFSKRNAAWEGTITQIREFTVEKGDSDAGSTWDEEWVALYYRTDDGKNGKWNMEKDACQAYCPNLQEGDRVVKKKGEKHPQKTS